MDRLRTWVWGWRSACRGDLDGTADTRWRGGKNATNKCNKEPNKQTSKVGGQPEDATDMAVIQPAGKEWNCLVSHQQQQTNLPNFLYFYYFFALFDLLFCGTLLWVGVLITADSPVTHQDTSHRPTTFIIDDAL